MVEPEVDDGIFGYDSLTGKQYTRLRKRKPNRYLLTPDQENNFNKYKDSVKWLKISDEQFRLLKGMRDKVHAQF